MAKEPHWKCGKAQAPRVRVPCPLPVTKTASTEVGAVFVYEEVKTRDSNPKGRDRKLDSPADCRAGSGSSRPKGEAQTGRPERSEMAAKSRAHAGQIVARTA